MTTLFSNFATKALLYEVAVTPKPGLVDRHNSGAHNDMDFFTFVDSCIALESYFKVIEETIDRLYSEINSKDNSGLADEKESFSREKHTHSRYNINAKQIFSAIQPLGVLAEKNMMETTNGVNTHKGAIYALGLNLAAVCESKYQCSDKNYDEKIAWIRNRIALYVTDAVNYELEHINPTDKKTYGIDQYLKYGLLGARGEAARGYPAVFEIGLPEIKKALADNLSLEHAAIQVLLKIIVAIDDSNVIGRKGITYLQESQSFAEKVLQSGAMRTTRGRELIEKYDQWCIKERISHGGAADLMAVVLFYYFINQ